MAHLATMMQGFHPFRVNDTVFQKTVAINDFYLKGRRSHLPARADPVAGPHARRDGADGRAAGAAVGVRRVGRAGRRLAGDDRRPAASREPRHDRIQRAASGCTTSRTTCVAHQRAGGRSQAHAAQAWLLDRDDPLAQGEEHDPSVRHAGASAPIRASRCSTPYCRTHDIDNLFVVDASFFPSSAAVNPG